MLRCFWKCRQSDGCGAQVLEVERRISDVAHQRTRVKAAECVVEKGLVCSFAGADGGEMGGHEGWFGETHAVVEDRGSPALRDEDGSRGPSAKASLGDSIVGEAISRPAGRRPSA